MALYEKPRMWSSHQYLVFAPGEADKTEEEMTFWCVDTRYKCSILRIRDWTGEKPDDIVSAVYGRNAITVCSRSQIYFGKCVDNLSSGTISDIRSVDKEIKTEYCPGKIITHMNATIATS